MSNLSIEELAQFTGGVGFLHEYCKYVAQRTHAPRSFHLGTGLSILSATVGDRVKYRAWDGDWVPNIYVLLLGPSGGGKSTALRMGRTVYELANGGKRVLPKDITMSALFRVFDPERDYGGPSQLWCHSELAQFLATLNSEYNRGLRETLTDMYDYEELSSLTMKDDIRRVHPAMSILSASNPEWLTAYVRENDVMGGFLPRFTFFPGTTHGDEPEDWDRNVKNDYSTLAMQLAYYANTSGYIEFEGQIPRMNMWMRAHREYAKEMQKRDPRLAPFLNRYEHLFIKMSVLLNLSMYRDLHIHDDAIEAAATLTTWVRNQFEQLVLEQFAFDRNSKGVLAIKNVIQSEGDLTERQMRQRLRGLITDPRDFDRALKSALDFGDIRETEISDAKGKLKTIYKAVA